MGSSIQVKTFFTICFSLLLVSAAGAFQEPSERFLHFDRPLDVKLRSSNGAVVSGELRSISESVAMIVTPRTRRKNPDGMQYTLDKIASVNLPELNVFWQNGGDKVEFLRKIAEVEEAPIANLTEFQALDKTLSETEMKTEETAAANKNIIVLNPAARQPKQEEASKVTMICGDCMKEVAIDSSVGKTCPHCGIEWDNSPALALNLHQYPANPASGQMQIIENQNHAFNNAQAQGNNAQPVANPVGIQQVNVPQPAVVPAPVTAHAAPQPMDLGNLPVWMKASIFMFCLGVMYYAFFYVR